MDYGLESNIWVKAQGIFSEKAFAKVLELAVASYRRRPGHFPSVRIDRSDIGESGLYALRKR